MWITQFAERGTFVRDLECRHSPKVKCKCRKSLRQVPGAPSSRPRGAHLSQIQGVPGAGAQRNQQLLNSLFYKTIHDLDAFSSNLDTLNFKIFFLGPNMVWPSNRIELLSFAPLKVFVYDKIMVMHDAWSRARATGGQEGYGLPTFLQIKSKF